MEIKKSNFLIVVIFASFLLSAMAGGHRKLLNKDEARSMETPGSSMYHVQEDDEVAAIVHKRILWHDYGRYNPTPTMSRPHFKDIPN